MMSNDFEIFKRTFKRFQDKFGLGGYTVYFKFELIADGSFADITICREEMVATARLNSTLNKKDEKFKHTRLSAKHEALHLLCGRLQNCALNRFVSEREITEATEELVNKLCGLIE